MSESTSEHWLPVVGKEPYYRVSDRAQIMSLHPRNYGRILKTPVGNHGYPNVNLSVHGKRTLMLVHKLVAEAFLGPCPDGMEVRHLDGVKTHCELSNLAYGTHSDNQWDQILHGTHANGSREACEKGHPYVPGSYRVARYPDGSFKERVCHQCERAGWAARQARKPPNIAACAFCGAEFDKGREHGKGRRRYCGPECQRAARSAQAAAYQERKRIGQRVRISMK